MARGGSRPGAGRPKGRKSQKPIISDEVKRILTGQGMPTELPEKPVLPLDYMLRVLNDPETDQDRRDKMAQLAVPYFHAKAEAKGTKKDGLMKRAGEVADGRFGARPTPNVIPIKKQG